MTETRRAYVGPSAWSKEHWKGHFYEKGLAVSGRLAYASARVTSLEINATFYAYQRRTNFKKWRSDTPESFRFAVKGNKTVTHVRRLRNPAPELADFLGSGVLELREKLGPIMWQLPPNLAFDAGIVEAFLAALPHSIIEARHLIETHSRREHDLPDMPDLAIRHAIEARHPSFDCTEFRELLMYNLVAPVVTNSPGHPTIDDVTADVVYARLHADATHNPDGYSDTELDDWAGRVNSWVDGSGCPDGMPRDVFVYFDSPGYDGTRQPFDALRLIDRLTGPSNNSAHRPPTNDPKHPELSF